MPRIYWRLIAEFLTSAREHDLAEVRLVLAAHPILINALDQQGQNALSVAGSGDAAEFLVDNGAVDPDSARRAAANAFKHYVAAGDVYRLVELVRFYTVDLAEVERDLGRSNTTLFHLALPHPETIEHLLDWIPVGRFAQGTDQEPARREPGTTPIQAVARRGLTKIARRLIKMGVNYDAFSAVALDDHGYLATVPIGDLRTVDGNGASLLHWASLHGSRQTVSWLVENGLEVDSANVFGETPLLMAALAGAYPGTVAPDDRRDVVAVLLESGARVDVFAAAAFGDEETVGSLLAADGGLAHAANPFGSTPLHFAAWAGRNGTAQALLDAGADVDAQDRHGRSPLFYAACWGRHRALVELLRKHDAQTTLKDIWGKDVDAYYNQNDPSSSQRIAVTTVKDSPAEAPDSALIRRLRGAFAWRRRPGRLFDSVAYDDWEQAFMDTVSAATPDELSFNEASEGGIVRHSLADCMPLMSTDGFLYFLGSFLALSAADYDGEGLFYDFFLWRFRYDPLVSVTVAEWPERIAGLPDESERAAGSVLGRTLHRMGQTFEERTLEGLRGWFGAADPAQNRLIARMTRGERDAVAGFFDFLAVKDRLSYAGPGIHAARAMLRGGSLANRLGARTRSECRSLIRSLELLEDGYRDDFPRHRTGPVKFALDEEAKAR